MSTAPPELPHVAGAPGVHFDVPQRMTAYFVGLLIKGARWSGERDPDGLALQQRHLAYLREQIEAGRYVVAGPVVDGGLSQGLILLRADSPAGARALVDGDPAVRAEHFAVELHATLLPSMDAVTVTY